MTTKAIKQIGNQFIALKLGSGLLTTLLVAPIIKWIIRKSR